MQKYDVTIKGINDKAVMEYCHVLVNLCDYGLYYLVSEVDIAVKEKEERIAALQERERVLIGRLRSYGDVETDKEEALRGEEGCI